MKKNKNQLLHLAVTLVIPVLIMTKLNGQEYLWPLRSLVVALAFPLGRQVRERYQGNKTDVFSVIGFVSILLTGGIGLLGLDPQRVAIKEAGVPLILGLVVAISILTGKSLVKAFLEQALPLDEIEASLDDKQRGQHDRLIWIFGRGFAGSFLISAILNYVLAKVIVTADAGTEEFTAQLGKMTGLSFPVIALPMMVVMMGLMIRFMIRLQKVTGRELEDLLGKKK